MRPKKLNALILLIIHALMHSCILKKDDAWVLELDVDHSQLKIENHTVSYPLHAGIHKIITCSIVKWGIPFFVFLRDEILL